MKKYILLPVLAGSIILAGCGKKEEAAASSAPAMSTAAAPAAPAAPAAAAFEITANDQMKFSVTKLEAKAGQDVKITLTNMGTLPKEAMGHNLVILKKGADVAAFATAAATARATDYVPAALADQVVAHTKVLGPKQSDEINFKAPAEAGEYLYICSFPGHYITMRGTLVVN